MVADLDFSFPHRATGAGELYKGLVVESIPMINGCGRDPFIGTKLPCLLQEAGFEAIEASGSYPLVLAWGNQPEWFKISAETVRAMLQLDGVTDDDYEELYRSLPGGIETGHVLMLSACSSSGTARSSARTPTARSLSAEDPVTQRLAIAGACGVPTVVCIRP